MSISGSLPTPLHQTRRRLNLWRGCVWGEIQAFNADARNPVNGTNFDAGQDASAGQPLCLLVVDAEQESYVFDC